MLSDADGWSYNVVIPGDTASFPRIMLLDRDLRILDPEVPANDAAILEAIQGARSERAGLSARRAERPAQAMSPRSHEAPAPMTRGGVGDERRAHRAAPAPFIGAGPEKPEGISTKNTASKLTVAKDNEAHPRAERRGWSPEIGGRRRFRREP